tara:strand:+ start:78 stop:284 length:207 start_codon:yes stop_codon:yes gene_type:complete
MEFVNEISEKENAKPENNGSLEIGYIKFTNGEGVEFEVKDVKVNDVQGLREFIWELIDEVEVRERGNR